MLRLLSQLLPYFAMESSDKCPASSNNKMTGRAALSALNQIIPFSSFVRIKSPKDGATQNVQKIRKYSNVMTQKNGVVRRPAGGKVVEMLNPLR